MMSCLTEEIALFVLHLSPSLERTALSSRTLYQAESANSSTQEVLTLCLVVGGGNERVGWRNCSSALPNCWQTVTFLRQTPPPPQPKRQLMLLPSFTCSSVYSCWSLSQELSVIDVMTLHWSQSQYFMERQQSWNTASAFSLSELNNFLNIQV